MLIININGPWNDFFMFVQSLERKILNMSCRILNARFTVEIARQSAKIMWIVINMTQQNTEDKWKNAWQVLASCLALLLA
jgi:hypothetical protein